MNEIAIVQDPIYDGAADPVVIWNRQAKEWWMIYTNRRATAEGPCVAWVHGTDLGVAVSRDGDKEWLYRGILQGLDIEWGRNTFWAPEIIWHDGLYHMYVSYIQGVPDHWGHRRDMLHYTSPNMLEWRFVSKLELSSGNVIDACIYTLPDGRYRMWYKDEGHHSHMYAADSSDLYHWQVAGPVITGRSQEGPNVFRSEASIAYWTSHRKMLRFYANASDESYFTKKILSLFYSRWNSCRFLAIFLSLLII